MCPYDLGLRCLKQMDVSLTTFKPGGWNLKPSTFFLPVATNIDQSAPNVLPLKKEVNSFSEGSHDHSFIGGL